MLALLACLSSTAMAASRLTITAEEVVVVRVGGEQLTPTMGGLRHTAPWLAGGLYPIEIRAEDGLLLFAGNVNLPDKGDVRGAWSRANGLVLSGDDASATAATPAVGSQNTRADGTPTTPYAPPPDKPAAAIDNSGSGSRDANAHDPHDPAGWAPSSDVTSKVESAAGVATIGSIGTNAVSGAASGVGTFVGNAQAGTSFGKTSTGYQAQHNPYAAPPVTGTVVLENHLDRPVEVYVDGMLLARLAANANASTQKVGAGLVKIEWYDPATLARIAGGTLKVEKDQRVGLSLGTNGIEAKDRVWTWAPDPS